MSKALNDFTHIRVQFEDFERKMLADIDKAIKNYGKAHTAEVFAKMVHIRNEMRKLATLIAPPVKEVPIGQWESDEEAASYGL